MTIAPRADEGRRLVGWVAIVGGLLGWATIGFWLAAVGGDLTVVYQPQIFLSLPSPAHGYFHAAMVLDTLGFYLPFLLIGGYLWSHLRADRSALIDIAALCIVTYVVMGIAVRRLYLPPFHHWRLRTHLPMRQPAQPCGSQLPAACSRVCG